MTFKLKQTDPQLIALFNHFAFDEAFKASGLDTKTAALCVLAANIGTNAPDNFRQAVVRALYLGADPVEIREVVYQAVPMAGFMRVQGFVTLMDEVFEEQGIALPLPDENTAAPDQLCDKGMALMKDLFGDYIEKLGSPDNGDSTDFDRWLVAYGFGAFMTRGGLDIKTRELVTFCLLYTQGGCEKETKTHVRVNMNIGNGKDVLVGVLKALTPFVGFPKTFNALNIVNAVAAQRETAQK